MIRQEIVFRTDAALHIGTGHVMRCLTLAEALTAQGANCRFICREHPGNLLDLIRQRGFEAIGLPVMLAQMIGGVSPDASRPVHSAWAGTDWATDARQSLDAIGAVSADWIVVDHYALDASWEKALRQACRRLMVIDDLADRSHDCDLLLDQNLGRELQDYAALVPEACSVLVGPQYALLRADFATLRDYSLARRASPMLRNVLITMGGVDQHDATGEVLEALKACPLPADCRITVVMGPHAPWLERVRKLAEHMPWATSVLVNVSDMAKLMADSDLAIGAAGSTSWERCCLGLPTLMVVLADNQREAASYLERAQAVHTLELGSSLKSTLRSQIEDAMDGNALLVNMIKHASGVTDGQGTQRVVANLSHRVSPT